MTDTGTSTAGASTTGTSTAGASTAGIVTTSAHRSRIAAALRPSLQRVVLWCLRSADEAAPHAAHRARPAPAPAVMPSSVPLTASMPAPIPTPSHGDDRPLGTPRVVVRLLGPFELTVDGTAIVDWQGRLGPMVLKFLLAQPRRRCSRDMLIEQFWPYADVDRARNRLHVAVSSLRRAVRASADVALIEHQDGWYRLSPTVELAVDVDEFDRCMDDGDRHVRHGDPEQALAAFRRAVHLYRGDYLADIPFEEWASTAREAYRAAYLRALERVAALAEELGFVTDATEAASRMLRVDPCREEAHRVLMRCHARQHRLTDVLRQFERCRACLADTIGVTPGPETVALYRQLRADLTLGCELSARP
ncbi:MAG: BTAD domain-containing putative transcriptional regulator [Acidimicrobiia bacterium]